MLKPKPDQCNRQLDYGKYANVLRRCGQAKALTEGKQLHCELAKGGYDEDTFLGNLLVQMYGNCGSLEDARLVFEKIRHPNVFSWNMITVAYAQNGHLEDAKGMFDRIPNPNTVSWNTIITAYSQKGFVQAARNLFEKMPERDAISWNAMIAAYTQNGHWKAGLELYKRMNLEGVQPTSATFVSTLDACANLASLRDGKNLLTNVVESGCSSGLVVVNSLVYMFSKCGCLEDARNMFYKMPEWNVVSWNIIIAAYAQNGHIEGARSLFEDMPERSTVSWNAMITAYAQKGHVKEAKRTFDEMPDRNVISWNAILAAFGQNGNVLEAKCLFDEMPDKNAISWNTIISAYAQAGHPQESLTHFYMMNLEGERPDRVSFVNVLDACSNSVEGKAIHHSFSESPYELDAKVGTALVMMYGRCGKLEDAKAVFEQLSLWDLPLCTAMITAYADNGCIEGAKELFDEMPEQDVVSWTAILVAYAQHGYLVEARSMFEEMPVRDVISWNAIIGANAQKGHGKEALELLPLMDLEGIQPDRVTLIILLYACTSMTSLAAGKSIHRNLMGKEYEFEVMIGSALVNMYGKCGSPEDARRIFDNIGRKNVVLWSSMLAAYSQNKLDREAFGFFRLMNLEGVEPDRITFMSLLSMCSHAGLLKTALRRFVSMSGDHYVAPLMEHYVCMLDLFGRLGRLADAEDLIDNMPFEPHVVAWTSLLGACKVHGDMERAGRAAKQVIKLSPSDSATYLLLSNMYAEAGNEGDETKVILENDSEGAADFRVCQLHDVSDMLQPFRLLGYRKLNSR